MLPDGRIWQFGRIAPTPGHAAARRPRYLHEAGLLDREKRGVWVYYRARTATLTALLGLPAAVG